MDASIDMSGDMSPPKIEPKSKINLSSFSNLTTKIPSVGEFIVKTHKNIRPWSEFINFQNFKTVGNVQRLTSRLMRNIAYFQSNYAFVFIGLVIWCLLTSPLILIVLGAVFYACYKVKKINTPITLFKKELNTNQQCILINCASVPVLYICGAGAAIFWVLGASVFVISLHAAFYNIDAVVTEDMEGFLAETV